MTVFLFAMALAVLAQDPSGPAGEPSTADRPDAAYADEVRCTGVLYQAQQQLRERDPRQRAIQNSLQTLNDRLNARVAAGEVAEATVAADLQAAINGAAVTPAEALAGCTAADPLPQVAATPSR